MNWSRARTILIVSFLALDIFLAYAAFGSRREISELTSTEVQQALARAREHSIVVKAQMPRRVMAAPFLSVRPRVLEAEMVAKRLLGPEPPRNAQHSKELSVWNNSSGQVTVLASGVILYTGAPARQDPQAKRLDSRAARTLFERYMQDRGMMPADARFDYVAELSSGVFLLQYHQDYGGTPLFGGYITALVDASGVLNMRMVWFEPSGLGQKKRLVMPAPDALAKAAPEIARQLNRFATVEAVKFGYFTEAMDAREWDVFPVWRFEIDGNVHVYVNGYSGDVEKIDMARR